MGPEHVLGTSPDRVISIEFTSAGDSMGEIDRLSAGCWWNNMQVHIGRTIPSEREPQRTSSDAFSFDAYLLRCAAMAAPTAILGIIECDATATAPKRSLVTSGRTTRTSTGSDVLQRTGIALFFCFDRCVFAIGRIYIFRHVRGCTRVADSDRVPPVVE
jgi:hypothetical protein